jgi:hypothetical protein
MYKIRRYYESYSKKKGMVTKSHIYAQGLSSVSDALIYIKERNSADIVVYGMLVTIQYLSGSGVPVTEKFKIIKTK